MKLFDATKPRLESPPDEQGRQGRRQSKKKAPQPPAEPETMEAGKFSLCHLRFLTYEN